MAVRHRGFGHYSECWGTYHLFEAEACARLFGHLLSLHLAGDLSGTLIVEAKATDKSDYEKDLEKQISETTDEDRKIQLQRDLDRERASRREERP